MQRDCRYPEDGFPAGPVFTAPRIRNGSGGTRACLTDFVRVRWENLGVAAWWLSDPVEYQPGHQVTRLPGGPITDNNMNPHHATYILIAPGFDLVQVALWTGHIRARGCRVAIVGLTPGELRSTNGVRWVPDLELDQVLGDLPGLVLIPGGGGCAAALARDPRVVHFLGAVRAGRGRVAGAREVEGVLSDQQVVVVPSMDAGGEGLLDHLIAYKGDEGRGRCLPSPGGEVGAPVVTQGA